MIGEDTEKCSVCGKILHADDEAYTDYDTGDTLCDNHSYFDESVDMYRKVELIEPSKRPIGEWVCTDPSTSQYGRINEDGTYDFKESVTWPDGSITQKFAAAIDLNDYSHDEKQDAIRSFGYSDGIRRMCHEDREWITAECIFELNEDF